jgi:hypothetical protein
MTNLPGRKICVTAKFYNDHQILQIGWIVFETEDTDDPCSETNCGQL